VAAIQPRTPENEAGVQRQDLPELQPHNQTLRSYVHNIKEYTPSPRLSGRRPAPIMASPAPAGPPAA
jgi:hypothetical protein